MSFHIVKGKGPKALGFVATVLFSSQCFNSFLQWQTGSHEAALVLVVVWIFKAQSLFRSVLL